MPRFEFSLVTLKTENDMDLHVTCLLHTVHGKSCIKKKTTDPALWDLCDEVRTSTSCTKSQNMISLAAAHSLHEYDVHAVDTVGALAGHRSTLGSTRSAHSAKPHMALPATRTNPLGPMPTSPITGARPPMRVQPAHAKRLGTSRAPPQRVV